MKRSEADCAVPQDVRDKLGDRYSDIKYVSCGATSMVFSAHDCILDKRIALKVLTPCRQEDFIRFQKEAKAASQLDHPKLVKILNFDVTTNNHAYLIMDYVEGDDLEQIVNSKGKLPLDSALEIALQICQAMEHAHQKQIAHRDLKASNIVISNYGEPTMNVTIVDFGLAHVEAQEPSGRSTPSGSIQGSPRYMSPEQAEGKSSDARSDIYALGCIIFKMVTGDTPFDDEDFMGVLRKHVSKEPPKLRDRTSAVIPERLQSAVGKLLEKNADARYQTMSGVCAALLEVKDELERSRRPGAPAESVAAKKHCHVRTHPVLWMPAAFTVLLIFATLFLMPYILESRRTVSPPANGTRTSPEAAVRKFKIAKIEFSDPNKTELLVTSQEEVTDEDLRYISGAIEPRCKGIDLKSFRGVKGEGIKYLRDLKINCLNAEGVKLTREGWRYLSQIKSLGAIVLDNSNVTDADLKLFEDHDGLWMVTIGHCQAVTDEGVRSLAKTRRLAQVDLTDTKVTDDGLKALSNCPQLRRLNLEGTQISDRGIRSLKPASRLFDLNLVACSNVTGASLEFIAKTWPNLTFLEIGGTTTIQTKDLEYLRPLKRMQHLTIIGIVVSDKELEMFGGFVKLNELLLTRCRFAEQSLKYLYPLKHLKSLALIGCTNMSERCVESLRKELSDCYVFCPLKESESLLGQKSRTDSLKDFKEMYRIEEIESERLSP